MNNAIRVLSEFVFRSDPPSPSDIIFIPGNRHSEPAEAASELYHSGYAPFILPSGRWSASSTRFLGQQSGRPVAGEFETEWAFTKAVLLANGVPEQAILHEDQARFTYQNAIASRQATDLAGIIIHKAILCCMPVHALRSYLYYQMLFPEAEILVYPANECEITRENWFTSAEGIDSVLDEIERCGNQFHEILKEKLLSPHRAFPSELEKRFLPNNQIISP